MGTVEVSVLSFEKVAFSHGKRRVLEAFDFEMPAGGLTLLAAPNGEGKTTVAWLAVGIYAPKRGQVRVFGQDPYVKRETLGRVGFLAEGAYLPPRWTGRQVLDFQRGTFPHWDASEAKRLVDVFDLDLKQRVKNMSRGGRGKLALAAVLSTKPELLVLDEPTLGLDVASRRRLWAEILGRAATSGCSILITTHEIAEAESAADRFVVLRDGAVGFDEPVADLLDRHRVLQWTDDVPMPPSRLDVVDLPTARGKRGLARRWDETVGKRWQADGGRVLYAGLETIFLAQTGEHEHA